MTTMRRDRWTLDSVAALALVALLGAAGCGDKENGPSGPCIWRGNKHAVGSEPFPAGDSCNRCICKEGGRVACTDMDCPAAGSAAASHLDIAAGGSSSVTCRYRGVEYPADGTRFPAADSCNRCHCAPNGDVLCTAMVCDTGGALNGGASAGGAYNPGSGGQGGRSDVTCRYRGVEYPADGIRFPAVDSCNRCHCAANGDVLCTAMVCEHAGAPNGSAGEGEAHNRGSGGQGGRSNVACRYRGVEYPADGTRFLAADNCNRCHCAANGDVLCTAMVCATGGSAGAGGAQNHDTGGEGGGSNVACFWHGVEYSPDSGSFPAGDGCNNCFCREDARVICTLTTCPDPEATEGGAGGHSG